MKAKVNIGTGMTEGEWAEYLYATRNDKPVDLHTHFRNGVSRDEVCHCGMQQGPKAKNNTCSQCGYVFPHTPNAEAQTRRVAT